MPENMTIYFDLLQRSLTSRKLILHDLFKEGKITEEDFLQTSQELLNEQISLTRSIQAYKPTY